MTETQQETQKCGECQAVMTLEGNGKYHCRSCAIGRRYRPPVLDTPPCVRCDSTMVRKDGVYYCDNCGETCAIG